MVNRFISLVITIVSEDSFITNLELKVDVLPDEAKLLVGEILEVTYPP